MNEKNNIKITTRIIIGLVSDLDLGRISFKEFENREEEITYKVVSVVGDFLSAIY